MSYKQTLIYKYPNLKALFETNCQSSPIMFQIVGGKYNVIPNYLNPHKNIINIDNPYYLSMHPSNRAVEMMINNPLLINLDGLVRNNNPNIGPLLEQSLHLFTKNHWDCMSLSSNPTILRFIENNPDNINWFDLSKNTSDGAIKILEKNQDKIVWVWLSSNPSAMNIIKHNLDKIIWNCFCKNTNPEAINILEKNIDKIDWYYLSSNPAAIHILSQNLDKLNSFLFSRNPNAMNILTKYPKLIDINAIMYNPNAIYYSPIHMIIDYIEGFATNPNCFPLIEKMLERGFIPEERISNLHNYLKLNESLISLFDLDYQAMSKQQTKHIYYELIEKALHPSRVSKWLDYHCENGGEIADFDWI